MPIFIYISKFVLFYVHCNSILFTYKSKIDTKWWRAKKGNILNEHFFYTSVLHMMKTQWSRVSKGEYMVAFLLKQSLLLYVLKTKEQALWIKITRKMERVAYKNRLINATFMYNLLRGLDETKSCYLKFKFFTQCVQRMWKCFHPFRVN